jgi:hypothetical protein
MASAAGATVVHPERDLGPRTLRRRHAVYAATTLALCLVMALAVADLFFPVLGVDADTVRGTASDGTELVVTYPSVTRPALASPFSIEVTRPGGFDGPIELAISRPWIEVWDENGMYPAPSSEVGEDDYVVWEFDPPDGASFRFFYDARMEPSRQRGIDGSVQLRAGGEVLAEVEFTTEVRP